MAKTIRHSLQLNPYYWKRRAEILAKIRETPFVRVKATYRETKRYGHKIFDLWFWDTAECYLYRSILSLIELADTMPFLNVTIPFTLEQMDFENNYSEFINMRPRISKTQRFMKMKRLRDRLRKKKKRNGK